MTSHERESSCGEKFGAREDTRWGTEIRRGDETLQSKMGTWKRSKGREDVRDTVSIVRVPHGPRALGWTLKDARSLDSNSLGQSFNFFSLSLTA